MIFLKHFFSQVPFLKDDYKKGGFPTMPIDYGQEFTNYLIMIYSLALLPISLYFWIVGICSNFYGVMAALLGCSFLYLVFRSFREKKYYKSVFLFSILYMLLVNVFISIDIIFMK